MHSLKIISSFALALFLFSPLGLAQETGNSKPAEQIKVDWKKIFEDGKISLDEELDLMKQAVNVSGVKLENTNYEAVFRVFMAFKSLTLQFVRYDSTINYRGRLRDLNSLLLRNKDLQNTQGQAREELLSGVIEEAKRRVNETIDAIRASAETKNNQITGRNLEVMLEFLYPVFDETSVQQFLAKSNIQLEKSLPFEEFYNAFDKVIQYKYKTSSGNVIYQQGFYEKIISEKFDSDGNKLITKKEVDQLLDKIDPLR